LQQIERLQRDVVSIFMVFKSNRKVKFKISFYCDELLYNKKYRSLIKKRQFRLECRQN